MPLAWGSNTISITKDAFGIYDKSVKLLLTFKKTDNSNADIQINYGDWSGKPSFYVDGTLVNADYNPGGTVGSIQTVAITFSETVYNSLKTKGMIIQGTGVTVTKALLRSGTSGINSLHIDRPADNQIYNLQGQQVTNPQHGIYIQNGKKFVKK